MRNNYQFKNFLQSKFRARTEIYSPHSSTFLIKTYCSINVNLFFIITIWQQNINILSKHSSSLIMSQLKLEKFKNQIRQKHKDKIMSELRSKLHYQTHIEDQFQSASHWRLYLAAPTPVIPLWAVKQFLSISEDMVYQVENIINKILDGGSLINVLFVTLCVETFSCSSSQFLIRVLESKKDHNMEEINFLKKVRNSEELYIGYYVTFMKKFNLNREEVFDIQLIEKIKNEFVEYWNRHVEQKTLNYKLCAQIAERFLKFIEPISPLKSLITGVVSVLIDQDQSPQSYYLVKVMLSCNVKLGLFITHHPNFANFMYKGLKQSTIKLAIQILTNLIERKEQYGEIKIEYKRALEIMHDRLMSTENKDIENYILTAFYNFSFCEEEQVQKFYSGISYEGMYRKIYKLNLMVFLEVCLSVIYNFPSQELYYKIIMAPELKLLQLSCQHILSQNNNQVWRYAEELLDAMEMLVEHQIPTNYLCEKLEIIIKKLESMQWGNLLQEKQRILQSYEGLVKRCAEKSHS